MSDIGRVLLTAKEALLSNLTAINVTGSNIANVNTPGYSRLRPMFESVGTKDATSAQGQAGVRIADVERIYDRFLETQIVEQQSSLANYSAQEDILGRVESVLNENAGGGINDALSAFLNAWGNLSIDPSSKSRRDMLLSTAQNLSYTFNQKAKEITDIQLAANESVADSVTTLNGYLTQMVKLNKNIVDAESAGNSASTLRDQRGELLNEIGKIIDVSYVEKSDGSLYIYLPSNGKALVEGINKWDLQAERNSNGMYDIVFQTDPLQPINDQINGGKLAGLLEVRDHAIPSYLDQLNQTASSIINKVNKIHINGYDQNGNPGGLFFESTAYAKDMKVSSAIIADTRRIAASATVNADGNNATAITAITSDQMYASIGVLDVTAVSPTASGTATLNNVGQAYKNTTTDIVITRGLTPGSWTVTNNGGYDSLGILTSNDTTVTLDLNGDLTADITLALSGTWADTDNISFGLTQSESTASIDGYFNAFIANMGQDVDNATRAMTSETAVLNQQTNQRDQLSGVSLDEEMMNLIKYQMAYGAAGRMTKTVNELMDILINLGQ